MPPSINWRSKSRFSEGTGRYEAFPEPEDGEIGLGNSYSCDVNAE